jgi:hypothetical protein
MHNTFFIWLVLFCTAVSEGGLSIVYPPSISGNYLSSSLDAFDFNYNVSGRIVEVKSACRGISAEESQNIEGHQEDLIALVKGTCNTPVFHIHRNSWY